MVVTESNLPQLHETTQPLLVAALAAMHFGPNCQKCVQKALALAAQWSVAETVNVPKAANEYQELRNARTVVQELAKLVDAAAQSALPTEHQAAIAPLLTQLSEKLAALLLALNTSRSLAGTALNKKCPLVPNTSRWRQTLQNWTGSKPYLDHAIETHVLKEAREAAGKAFAEFVQEAPKTLHNKPTIAEHLDYVQTQLRLALKALEPSTAKVPAAE